MTLSLNMISNALFEALKMKEALQPPERGSTRLEHTTRPSAPDDAP